MEYISESDCLAEKNLTQSIKNDSNKYLGKFESSFSAEQLPDNEGKTINNTHYSGFVKKFTECSITQQAINIGDNTPEIKI